MAAMLWRVPICRWKTIKRTATRKRLELVGRQLGSDVMARADLQVENNKKNRYSEAVLAGLFDPESSFNHNEAASECCVCHRNVAAADEGRKDGLCSNCRALLELGKAS